jgi:hypothetical protein
MSDEHKSDSNRLRDQLRRYYELLRVATDTQAIKALSTLISETEARLRELGAGRDAQQ